MRTVNFFSSLSSLVFGILNSPVCRHYTVIVPLFQRCYNGGIVVALDRKNGMVYEFDCVQCGKHVRVRRTSGQSVPRFCSLQCKGQWQHEHRERPVSDEWLYQKYIMERLDCVQIGKLVDRDPSTVHAWLREAGIQTRKRGTTGNHLYVTEHPMLGKHHSPETREKLRQARLRDGTVPYLKNGVHHLKGKRGADTPNWKGGVTKERQMVYGSPEWKAAVKVVWKRDNATCQRCHLHHSQAKQQGIGFDMHHIVSFAVPELRCEPSNLVLLCEPCHYWVHSAENINKEFLK